MENIFNQWELWPVLLNLLNVEHRINSIQEKLSNSPELPIRIELLSSYQQSVFIAATHVLQMIQLLLDKAEDSQTNPVFG